MRRRKALKDGVEAWLNEEYRGRDLATITEIRHIPAHLTGTMDKALGSCAALITLNLSNCRYLSGTLLVVGNCKGLTSLNLCNCDKLTGTLDSLDNCKFYADLRPNPMKLPPPATHPPANTTLASLEQMLGRFTARESRPGELRETHG
jgi:hypothetical protein